MKKLLLIIMMTLSVNAMAHGPHGHWRHGGGSNWVWVAPTIIGGVIGYEIAKNQNPPVVIQQQTIPQPPIVQSQNCSPWTEIRNPDGTITYTRTCQ